MVERHLAKVKVESSNLFTRSIQKLVTEMRRAFLFLSEKRCVVAQMVFDEGLDEEIAVVVTFMHA